jgi:hypothetical protein
VQCQDEQFEKFLRQFQLRQPPPPTDASSRRHRLIRVGGVNPGEPEVAHAGGAVLLEITIGADGSVSNPRFWGDPD